MHAVQGAVLHKLNPAEDDGRSEQEHDDGNDRTEQYNEPGLRQDIVWVVVIYWKPVGVENGKKMESN